jgi:uncharacterized protein (TIGR03435 family)
MARSTVLPWYSNAMRRLFLISILVPTFAFAQSRKEFEVASVKVATEQIQQVGAGLHIDGSQVSLVSLSIRDLVGMAYRVRPNQISGPDWIGSQRYNIAGKLPDGAPQDQVPEMIQSLLADRFQMKTHRETKDLPVYAIGVAKGGAKLTALPPDPELDGKNNTPVNVAAGGSANGVAINLGNGRSIALSATALEVRKLDMTTLADMLTRFSDRTVADMTNLKGRYDLTLPLTPEDQTAMLIRSALNAGLTLPPQALRALDVGSTASLSNSLEKVGLTFEAKRAPLEVLVIDSVQKTPTEN